MDCINLHNYFIILTYFIILASNSHSLKCLYFINFIIENIFATFMRRTFWLQVTWQIHMLLVSDQWNIGLRARAVVTWHRYTYISFFASNVCSYINKKLFNLQVYIYILNLIILIFYIIVNICKFYNFIFYLCFNIFF